MDFAIRRRMEEEEDLGWSNGTIWFNGKLI